MDKTLIKYFAAGFISTAATLALMATPVKAEEVAFSYSAQELATTQGAENVEKRLRKFARRTCLRNGSMLPQTLINECRADVETQLRQKIWGAGSRQPIS